MSQDIRIKKGLTIKLTGDAQKEISDATLSKIFAIKPTDLLGVTPKLAVRVGDKVKAGDVLFYSKAEESIKVLAPVSGEILKIERGAKRKILTVQISTDATIEYIDFGAKNPKDLSSDEVKTQLLAGGCWPFIQQRPYDVMANPNEAPKAIFVSAHDTAPLAGDVAFSLENQKEAFQAGITALSKMTTGKVHLAVCGKSVSFLNDVKDVSILKVTGKHPAGNVGVQIHHVNPINQGERVWTVNPQDVAVIGNLFLTGKFEPKRVVALVGSQVKSPKYFKMLQGANLETLLTKNIELDNSRVINGNVLTGTQVTVDGYLDFKSTTISVIPEGNHHTMFGWMPFTGGKKFSMYRSALSFLSPNKKYTLDTNLNGEERAFVMTGEMEKVLPMDILPMHLLKAAMVGDIEKMEALGIYEVAPEDFALIDYSSSSKIEAQQIIRTALDIMVKEVG